MIFEQVYFVDVEKTAICAREQSGIEGLTTGRQGALDIDGPANAILSRTERKLDNRHRCLFRSDLRSATLIAQLFRIAVIRTTSNDVDLRQQVRERAHRSGLPCTAMTHDQNSANQWVDNVQQQGELHVILANKGREWICFAR